MRVQIWSVSTVNSVGHRSIQFSLIGSYFDLAVLEIICSENGQLLCCSLDIVLRV